MAESRGDNMTIKLVTDQKVAETSSKGNQEKWLDDGRWYKLDQFGYESLAETFTSLLLARSNLETDTPFRFTRDEKSRTFSSNSKRSHILRTSSRSRRLILSSIVSFAVWLKCTRTI